VAEWAGSEVIISNLGEKPEKSVIFFVKISLELRFVILLQSSFSSSFCSFQSK
jgi:hypothetical protein